MHLYALSGWGILAGMAMKSNRVPAPSLGITYWISTPAAAGVGDEDIARIAQGGADFAIAQIVDILGRVEVADMGLDRGQ